MDVLADAIAGAAGVAAELSRALLVSKAGHAVLRLAWHLVDPALLLLYVALKYAIGPALLSLPEEARAALRSALIFAAGLVSGPSFVAVPLREACCAVALEMVLVRHGHEAQEDLEVFLRLGEGKKYRQRAIKWGSGRQHDFYNRFFPTALAEGPPSTTAGSDDEDEEDEDEEEEGADESLEAVFCGPGNDEVANLNHLQIAETALLLSILCYRSDATIADCLRGGMMPSVRFYSVRTASDANLAVFVAREWAVFCFRGTEAEAARDWLASALVEDTAPFGAAGGDGGGGAACPGGGRRVRRRYYQSMRAACGEGRARRYALEPPVPLEGRLDATAFDLAELLHGDGVKIYATGHSVGGGMAELFGAHIAEHLGVVPAAVVAFGSPPVAGNERFARWYAKSVPCSWRFVHGNELVPMSPPLPFFPSSVRLLHVGSAVDASRLRRRPAGAARRAADKRPAFGEEEAHLDRLARTMGLSSALLDHNPVLTMRVLHLELSRAEHAVSSLSLED